MKEEFRKWLDEAIEEARQDMKETCNGAQNSSGCAMDMGIWHGLKKARSYFTDEDWI